MLPQPRDAPPPPPSPRAACAGGQNAHESLCATAGLAVHCRYVDRDPRRRWGSVRGTSPLMGMRKKDAAATWRMCLNCNEHCTTIGHPVDLYTKSGDVGAYSSILILIPDYRVAVPILAAGSDSATAVGVAVERVVQGILPALETAARGQAATNLGGMYSTTATNSTLVLKAGQDGMVIEKWVSSNGVDTLAGLGMFAQSSGRTLRRLSLVPMGLEEEKEKEKEKEAEEEEEDGQRRVYYRALIETTLDGVDEAVPRVNDLNDVAWNLLDAYQWGGIGIDEFVFMLGEDGKATAVRPRAMRETYYVRR